MGLFVTNITVFFMRFLFSKKTTWFKSYNNFAELVDFANWCCFSSEGSAINGATPSGFINPWLGRPAGGTINGSDNIGSMKEQRKTKCIFLLLRNTFYELPGATDSSCFLKVWDSKCCLFVYLHCIECWVLNGSMCCTNYDLHNKQTHYCHFLSC